MRSFDGQHWSHERVSGPLPPLGQQESLRSVVLRDCTVTSWSREAFDGEGPPFEVELGPGARIDHAALLKELVVSGPGRWRITRVTGAPRSMVRDLRAACKLGGQHAGDARLRRVALRLLCGKPAGVKPRARDVALLDWSNKTVRERAMTWLADTLPEPALPAEGAVVLLGKPTRWSRVLLREAVEARGLRIVVKPELATHAVLSPLPGARLARAMGLTLLLEPWLRPWVQAVQEQGPDLNTQQSQSLGQLLASTDTAIVEQGLFLAEQVALDGDVLPDLLVCVLAHPDRKVRAAAKRLLLARGPRPVAERFASDPTPWHKTANTARLRMLLDDIEALGVDPARFGLTLASRQIARKKKMLKPYLRALLGRVPLVEVLDALNDPFVSEFSWRGELLDGLSRLHVSHLVLSGGPVDLTPLAGSRVHALSLHAVTDADSPWDLRPLVACPKLKIVSCFSPRPIGAALLRRRGITVH